ncbi:helix-turn-helix transcriptional regulator [Sphingomonas sp. BK069]|uniref:helix-turn-helix domain-containing protein n=1 Tax=Sphingomonas sp. BK069 TaxID=2586979 RepID=UPI0016082D72|nr:helix-turn-helix transcriptional regulator [Sphingomonas sp. BK069]MBB3350006.1 transcriptional regulator with XRE-family HTH domain [Sphingomonas sp. BK069]
MELLQHEVDPTSSRPYTIADFIVSKMDNVGVSQRGLAARTGYSRSRINRILREEDRLPITMVEAHRILASLGVGELEAALAQEVIRDKAPVTSREMEIVVSLIAVVFGGLATKIASLVDVVEGLEFGDIRREHGLKVQKAIFEMLKDLYTDLMHRKDDRIDHTRY